VASQGYSGKPNIFFTTKNTKSTKKFLKTKLYGSGLGFSLRVLRDLRGPDYFDLTRFRDF
jgi:hypothetical protein